MPPERIVLFHAAAIGDSVLATPVAVTLRKNFPECSITYVTHDSLRPLLSLCRAIDDFQSWSKKDSSFSVRQRIGALKPSLVVDLSGSTRSFIQTEFLAPKVVHYKKEKADAANPMHAVNNYLETLKILGLKVHANLFPTLFPQEELLASVGKLVTQPRATIALVPGVGSLRPHRAWSEERWVSLARHIIWTEKHSLILLGGPEDRALCSRITEAVKGACVNLAGKLSLPETAAALALCQATVSGDTGPAHISVAVGTPCVGLYGPTLIARSGPYGMDEFCLDARHHCRCFKSKHCSVSGPDKAGACMDEIVMEDVYGKLCAAIASVS